MYQFFQDCFHSVKEEEAHLFATMAFLGFSSREYDEAITKIREAHYKFGSDYLDALQNIRAKLMKTGSIEKALKP